MKGIFKMLIVAAMAATIPLAFTSCKDEWDDDNNSTSQDNKFDYIYSCIGKSGLSVIAQIENDGYGLTDTDDDDRGTYYAYVKHDYNKGASYYYVLAVQNNVVKAMKYAEEWDYGKADCKKMKESYTQMVSSADSRISPIQFEGSVKVVPYGSTSGDWVHYTTVSGFINAIKNYTITNNCVGGEYISAEFDMDGSTFLVRSDFFLRNRSYDDYPDDNYGPSMYIDVIDREWYEYEEPYEPGPSTLLNENFDAGTIPSSWMIIDNDKDGFNWWNGNKTGITGHNGSTGCAVSQSYDNNMGALTPDNWLVSPSFTLPNRNYNLSWYVAAQEASYPNEVYDVYIGTRNGNSYTWTASLYHETVTAKGSDPKEQGTWRYRSVDLSSYAGQTVAIAFRHHDCADEYFLLIDDVMVYDRNQKGFPWKSRRAKN